VRQWQSFPADRRPGFILEIDVGELSAVAVDHDEGRANILD